MSRLNKTDRESCIALVETNKPAADGKLQKTDFDLAPEDRFLRKQGETPRAGPKGRDKKGLCYKSCGSKSEMRRTAKHAIKLRAVWRSYLQPAFLGKTNKSLQTQEKDTSGRTGTTHP